MKKNTQSYLKVCFAGGGTGGHIYPGLAVADSLRSLCKSNNKEIKIYWIGNSKGMDKDIVSRNVDFSGKRSADTFYGIPSGKLRRYFSLQNFFDIFKIIAGFISSYFILLKIKPDILFSKGGFVSVPPCFAARMLKIPVFTHECDFTPGLATRINSKSAKKILVSYEDTKKYLSFKAAEKCLVTGNPVRPVFTSFDSQEKLEESHKRALSFLNLKSKDKPLLFVQGGSLGAKQINELVKDNIEWLCQRFIVIHQTGQKNVEESKIEQMSELVKANYKAFPFIYSEMCDLMALSDLILSRAGANSIWECAALKKPMLLIPLTGSGTRGDQEDNAEYFEKKGGAIVLSRENANGEKLKAALERLLDEGERLKMSENLKKMASSKTSAEIISEILYNEII